MGKTNGRLFYTYTILITFITLLVGFMIVPIVEGSDRVIVLLALIGGYTAIGVSLYQIYINYIKPVKSATDVMQELIKGNYKIRAYENYNQNTGTLANSINQLARNLQDMNRQEKMQGRQLRTVIDNMESAVMLIDQQGYVHLVNRKFIELFGKKESSYTKQLYYEVLEQEQIYSAIQEAFLYEQKVKDAITIKGEPIKRYIELVGAPIFNEAKDLRGVVIVFHDITDLKKVEKMRKDFVANVSHELRTPITSIKGFAETLLDEQLNDLSIQNKFLNIIYNESDRLQALVRDLLELSRLEKEEMTIQTQTFSIDDLLESVITIVDREAKKKAIDFQVDLDKTATIEGDPDRLKQLFNNLLYNAINYTPNNGKVILTVRKHESYVEIIVEDNGIGIPKDKCSRIFERFYRVDKARSRDTGGTGLGLAIVKHIVEAHQGSIQVESVIDEGSKFIVNLPISNSEKKEA